MNLLDMMAALGALVGVLACFVTHAYSAPKRRLGFPMPPTIRAGYLIVGIFGLFWSFHMGWISFIPAATGHATWASVGTIAALDYYFLSVAYSVSVWRLPPPVWENIHQLARDDVQRRREAHKLVEVAAKQADELRITARAAASALKDNAEEQARFSRKDHS